MLLAGPLLAEFPVPSQGLFSWGHCPYIGSFLWGFSWTVLRLSEGGTQYKFPGQAFTSFPDALCSTSKPLLRKSFILRTQRFSHHTFKWYPGVPLHASMLSHFSRIRLFATPWTVAHQAPLSTGFSRQEYRSGLPRPPPGAKD